MKERREANENIVNAVKVIKAAILESQAQVLRRANSSLPSLYYGIWRFPIFSWLAALAGGLRAFRLSPALFQ